MKQIMLVALQLLAALGLVGGVILLEGTSVPLQKLLIAILMLYVTGLLDWYVFFSRAVSIPVKGKIAVGIFSAAMFVLIWVWLFLIVWSEQRV